MQIGLAQVNVLQIIQTFFLFKGVNSCLVHITKDGIFKLLRGPRNRFRQRTGPERQPYSYLVPHALMADSKIGLSGHRSTFFTVNQPFISRSQSLGQRE
jgi:hypothetical protein